MENKVLEELEEDEVEVLKLIEKSLLLDDYDSVMQCEEQILKIVDSWSPKSLIHIAVHKECAADVRGVAARIFSEIATRYDTNFLWKVWEILATLDEPLVRLGLVMGLGHNHIDKLNVFNDEKHPRVLEELDKK
jgi:hypothetical protein